MKENKRGITLVALVVTIIILLILAGITISQLTGSGLFENAKLAEQKSENAQVLEDAKLEDYENRISEYVNGNRNQDLASLTPGTATAQDIASGKTAWVNGEKVTGTKTGAGSIEMIKLGTFNTAISQTINIAEKFSNYESFTIDNFVLLNTSITSVKGYSNVWIYESAVKSYDSSTGILTLGKSMDTGEGWGRFVVYNLYLLNGEVIKQDGE